MTSSSPTSAPTGPFSPAAAHGVPPQPKRFDTPLPPSSQHAPSPLDGNREAIADGGIAGGASDRPPEAATPADTTPTPGKTGEIEPGTQADGDVAGARPSPNRTSADGNQASRPADDSDHHRPMDDEKRDTTKM